MTSVSFVGINALHQNCVYIWIGKQFAYIHVQNLTAINFFETFPYLSDFFPGIAN